MITDQFDGFLSNCNFNTLKLNYFLSNRPSISDLKVHMNPALNRLELAVTHYSEGICIYPILEGGLLDDNNSHYISLPTDFIAFTEDNCLLLSMWGTRISLYKYVRTEEEGYQYGGRSRDMPMYIGRLALGNVAKCTEYVFHTYTSSNSEFDCVKRLNYPSLDGELKIGLGHMCRPWDVCSFNQMLMVTESMLRQEDTDHNSPWGLQLYHLPIQPLQLADLTPFLTLGVVPSVKVSQQHAGKTTTRDIHSGPNYVTYAERLHTIFTSSQENYTIGFHKLSTQKYSSGSNLVCSRSSYINLLPDDKNELRLSTKVKPGPMAWDGHNNVLFVAAQHPDEPAVKRNCIYCFQLDFN